MNMIIIESFRPILSTIIADNISPGTSGKEMFKSNAISSFNNQENKLDLRKGKK